MLTLSAELILGFALIAGLGLWLRRREQAAFRRKIKASLPPLGPYPAND